MKRCALSLLSHWFDYAQTDWHPIPGQEQWGFYGTGFNGWGVQTHQKYLAAAAMLAEGAGLGRDRAGEQAMAALRWNLATHQSGNAPLSDGSRWGHTWISALGIERMMHGVERLRPRFDAGDHEALRRVLCSEAHWLLHDMRRGSGATGVTAGLWGEQGHNHPESNLWNGALLWRTAMLYPDHRDAPLWQERAHTLFINSVSVATDAFDETVLGGRPVCERHIGANFFPHYALDHHAYTNVGYMAICVSNAAMLYFDLRDADLPIPETLHHHQRDLWQVLRELVFDDGRLIRIGGDTRIRYAYCQDYLLPALLYAADYLGDSEALARARGMLSLIEEEARANGDGSFFARRLASLRAENLLYHTRLESDRACVLGMALAYSTRTGSHTAAPLPPLREWAEPEYGAVFVKSPRRFASFAWRANGLAQGLCLPPGDGHLAEWEHNLAGAVRFASHAKEPLARPSLSRRLEHQHTRPFAGGFLTVGTITEGAEVALQEGWQGQDCARHQIAYIALPDERTVLGLQYCRTHPERYTLLSSVKGLHLNLPNDLYNGFTRTLETARGALTLNAPAKGEEAIGTGSRWASLGEAFGVVGVYGAKELMIHREATPRGGKFGSLHVEEIVYPLEANPRMVAPGSVVLDAGWAVLSGAGSAEVAAFAQQVRAIPCGDFLRAIDAPGADGAIYLVVVNFSEAAAPIQEEWGDKPIATSHGSGKWLEPGEARLYRRGRTDGPSTQAQSSINVTG